MTRLYPAPFRFLSGNFNPFDGIVLGVNMVALNGQNIDKDLYDYINFFTTRNGYRNVNTTANISSKKKYKL